VVVACLVLGFGVVCWLSIDTWIVGLAHDDGVYMVLAKALAQGHGFVLDHLYGSPAQIKYPILLPFLLSLLWRVFPDFPNNLLALGAVPVLASSLGLGLTYGFLRRRLGLPWLLALLVCLATGLQYQFASFASSFFSEPLYFALSVGLLWLGSMLLSPSQAPSKPWPLVGAIVCSVLLFHARMMGLTLVLALGLALVYQKQWQKALLYMGLTLLLTVGAWQLWTMPYSMPGLESPQWPLLHPYRPYGAEISENISSAPYLVAVGLNLGGLIGAFLEMMFPIFKYGGDWQPGLLGQFQGPMATAWVLVGSLAAYVLFGYLGLANWKQLQRGTSPSVVNTTAAFLALYVFCYFAVILAWGYDNQAIRFLSVILPWLWILVFWPLWQVAWPRLKAAQWAPRFIRQASVGPILAIGLWLIAVAPMPQGMMNLLVFRQHHILDPAFPWFWGEYQKTFAWIRHHVPPEVGVAGIWDPAIYLYTGHRSAHVFYAALARHAGQFTDESYPRLYNSLCANHIGVVALEPAQKDYRIVAPYNPVVLQLIKLYPQSFRWIYRTPRKTITLFRLNCSSQPLPKGH
jgi:hypothetical protein